MAQMGETFDATAVAPAGSFDALPNGKYIAAIIDSEWKATKAGTGHMLRLTLEVLDGEYKGRKFWDQLNLQNPNQTAVEIAQRTLSAICHATGVLQLKDSSQLHNIPMLVKVTVSQQDGYEPRNEVKGYAAVAGASLTAPAATSVAKAAAGRPAAAPWAKAKEAAA
jgi:hypothetical protein